MTDVHVLMPGYGPEPPMMEFGGPATTLNRMNAPIKSPWVEIVEQPQCRKIRFRYECEGRSAGSIPGENSTQERRTYPSIKLHNYEGPAIVVVSCVTRDQPYQPHPHAVVGKDCNRGVCTVKLKNASLISFPNLGIQCCKKKDVVKALKNRQQIRVDPFGTGFAHIQNPNNIDLGVVRLCFQVFLPDNTGKFTRIVSPAVSQAIFDRKTANELVICRIDRHSGRARGGEDVFLLCEKVVKDDIEVRFYEETLDGTLVWEGFGEFGQGDVHRQFAIVFKTPPYRDVHIQQPQQVLIQLRRPSDNEVSDPKPFQYMPEEDDPDGISMKRKRKAIAHTEAFMNDILRHQRETKRSVKTEPGTVSGLSSDDVRHILKSTIRDKQKAEPANPYGGLQGFAPPSSSQSGLPTMHPVTMGMAFSQDQPQVTVVASNNGEQPGLFTQLLSAQVGAEGATMTQVVGGEDKLLGTNRSMVITGPELNDQAMQTLLQEVDQLGNTAQLGNYSFNFSFTEPEKGLTGEVIQVDMDQGVAAHENVVSGDEVHMVTDPELNAKLLEVKKQLATLSQSKS